MNNHIPYCRRAVMTGMLLVQAAVNKAEQTFYKQLLHFILILL